MPQQIGILMKEVHADEKTIILTPSVTPEMFRELRFRFRSLRNPDKEMSLSEFGVMLKQAVNPKAKHPYSRQYIDRLEKGKDVITPKLIAAYYEIDGRSLAIAAGTGGAVAVSVIAQPDQVPDGAFIPRSARTVRCQRPGCAVQFVKTHPSQKYHDPECK